MYKYYCHIATSITTVKINARRYNEVKVTIHLKLTLGNKFYDFRIRHENMIYYIHIYHKIQGEQHYAYLRRVESVGNLIIIS